MAKVYAVNSGSYSDYRICGIFSTQEKAAAFMQYVRETDYNDIEVYELDPPTVDLIKRGYSIWRVLMLRDGTTERIDKVYPEYFNVSDVGNPFLWRRTQAPAYLGKGIPDAWQSTVWAKTEKQAIKIVNEQRLQLIALGKWEG